MRTLRKNKQKMYYALQIGEVPVYETDEMGNIQYYEDNDGKRYPLETGETKIGYGEPVEFFGNIAMSGGDSEAVEFGIDLSQYSAVLVVEKGSLPLDETSLIWKNTEPKMNDDGTVDEALADYNVVKVSSSLNVDKFVLKATNK